MNSNNWTKMSAIVVTILAIQTVTNSFIADKEFGLKSLLLLSLNLLVLCWLIFFNLHLIRARHPKLHAYSLVVLLIALIWSLAQINYFVSQAYNGSFIGLNTQIDAIYFVVTMISSGAGAEIYPMTQSAKLLVSMEIVICFALTAYVLVGEFKRRRDKSK